MNNTKYINAYNAANYTQIQIRFRKDDPADVAMIEHVKAQGNIQAYIKGLIIRDLEKSRDTKMIQKI